MSITLQACKIAEKLRCNIEFVICIDRSICSYHALTKQKNMTIAFFKYRPTFWKTVKNYTMMLVSFTVVNLEPVALKVL